MSNFLSFKILIPIHVIYVFFIAGEYLALTGDKLDGVEMIACRLATHYTLSEVSSFAH